MPGRLGAGIHSVESCSTIMPMSNASPEEIFAADETLRAEKAA